MSQLHSELRESTPTSPTSSFNSVPETFDSNENTPQNSHSELTPEVAMYVQMQIKIDDQKCVTPRKKSDNGL